MSQRIYIVLLAAGQSKRYGKTKLLDDLQGRPLLQHAL
ncbi:MAG: NTP transferase domain-containing protein, partial [Gammaproteobacteria bacterium]|nr:NTP transferase domain-containing protein [Gammaproteobacteria bacterium]